MDSLPQVNPREALEFFRKKQSFTLGPADVQKLLEAGADFALIDVRASEDYTQGHAPGALSLPEGRWASLAGLRKDMVNVLYCYSQHCHLAARAAIRFAEAGYRVMEMDGGFEAWRESQFEIESEPGPSAARRAG